MSKPAFNDFSTKFVPEALGVEVLGSVAADVTTDKFGVDRYSGIIVYLDIASITGTLDVKLRTIMPDDTTGIQIAAMTQITAAGKFGMGFVSAGNAVFTDAALAAGTFKTIPLGQKCDIFLDVTTGPVVITRFDVILVR